MTLIIRRISNFRAVLESDRKKDLRLAKKILSFWIDGAEFSLLFQNHVWDGFHRFYDKQNVIDFGLHVFLKSELDKQNIDVKLIDFEKYSGKIDISKTKLSEPLWQHQQEAVREFFKNDYGILVIPTRGGKTFTSAECIRITRIFNYKKSLFIVDTEDLFKQTISEFSKFLNISPEQIGQIKGTDKIDFSKEINVAMIQTLSSVLYPSKTKDYAKQKERKIKKFSAIRFLKTIDFLIVDEVHEYSSKKRVGVIKKAENIKFGAYLSATPEKSEGVIPTLTIKGYTGDVIYKIEESILQDRGVLAKDSIFILLFENHVKLKVQEDDKSEYQYAIENTIIHDENRNKIIEEIIRVLEDLTLKTLVMFSRKNHGNLISKRTGHIFISGDDDSETRSLVKGGFLEGEGKILLASDIYKKGVSLNTCQVMLNVSGGLEQSNVIQRRGRVLASGKGKDKCLIIDIFDNVSYFKEHCESRLNAYEKVSGDRIEIFNTNDKDFISKFKKSVEQYFGKRRI